MAIIYNLTINSIEKIKSYNQLNDVICEFNITVETFSEEYPELTYTTRKVIRLDTSDVDGDSFIAFEDITKDTLLNWMIQKEGVETIEELPYVKSSMNNIQDRIELLQENEKVDVEWSFTNQPTVEV